MKSKWFGLKDRALQARRSGQSIKYIEKTLKIPRSTLSGWFKGIELTSEQRANLTRKWKKALTESRKKAVLWHNKKKQERLRMAEIEAVNILNKIKHNNKILELSVAMLYLGEGFKRGTMTGIGNTDPLILKFFVEGIIKVYNFKRDKIKCELHLRADQNQDELKSYWSKELKIPKSNFTKTSFDKRTSGIKTYKNYKGVCVIKFGTVAIQRKLVYLSRQFCERIIKGD